MKPLAWLAITVVLIGIWWRFFRVDRPAIPPLVIDENDPLMQEAIRQAKSSIQELRQWYGQRPQHTNVKVPFKTSAGETEFLWGQVLELHGDAIKVRLLTPPVSHTGTLERLQTYSIGDLVDWVVVMSDGKMKDGYTMRVMFKKGREQWGDLPDELEKEEQKYLP